MSQTPPGTRVGAIQSADPTTVRLLGYGEYLGDLPAPFGPFGMPRDELRAELHAHGLPENAYRNPCIRLDSGRYVWGQQCWWGPEARVRELIGDRAVEAVEIESLAPLPDPPPPAAAPPV